MEILIMATKEVDARDLIMDWLQLHDRRLSWLSKKTGLSYGHLYFVFKRKERDLTDENKQVINKLLKTSF